MSELKSYINRVLGNSLRCLLPSYWWKRLFGLVVDRIDEVESTLSTSIDEAKRDVEIPILESEEELENLNVPIGKLATVIGKGRSFRECYWPTEFPENGDDIFPLLTHIPNINVSEGPITSFINILLQTSNNDGMAKVIQLVVDDREWAVAAVDGVTNRVYILSRYGQVNAAVLQEFNDLLASDVYRYIGRNGYNNLTEEEFDALDKLIRWDVSSDAYIKGGSWERLVKERDLEGIGGGTINADDKLSDTSENAVQNKVVTAALKNKVDKVDGKQLSTEDFTSLLKAKLEGLSNYDDTSIRNAINSLTTQINTLVSGDASVAIESFNEIIAFLNGIEDSESLDSIIAAIEQQIAGCATTAILEQEIANVESQITGVASAIPTKISQLYNDNGFATEAYVNTQVRTAIISALNTEV